MMVFFVSAMFFLRVDFKGVAKPENSAQKAAEPPAQKTFERGGEAFGVVACNAYFPYPKTEAAQRSGGGAGVPQGVVVFGACPVKTFF
jgi:hypothetical protein